jgi:hypothetical protein
MNDELLILSYHFLGLGLSVFRILGKVIAK